MCGAYRPCVRKEGSHHKIYMFVMVAHMYNCMCSYLSSLKDVYPPFSVSTGQEVAG